MEQEPKDKSDEQSGPDPVLVWGDEAPVPILPENETKDVTPSKTEDPKKLTQDKTISKIGNQ